MNRSFIMAECGVQGYFAGRVQLGQIYRRISSNYQDCEHQKPIFMIMQ